MAHPDITPTHIRLDDRGHVDRPLLDSLWGLRLEGPRRG